MDSSSPSIDLMLSSGFLAFARHLGVLESLETEGWNVQGVCGTSSGALVGALYASGMSLEEIAEELSAQVPLTQLAFHAAPWKGMFSLRRVVKRLHDWLPPRFSDLERPFAVGVMGADGQHVLLREGALPEAVAASCAIPMVFAPVLVEGVPYQDGGFVDRLGADAWTDWRGPRPTVVHLVDRSNGAPTPPPENALLIRTPRSGAQFWSLGDFHGQIQEARSLADQALKNADY